ncbi:hypothetical protein JXL21_07455 [Candidatus Bathyarchaeota archaeon]|nr:hypothetical protein [Candidatus Bathyarchaeota archaeon]
MTIGDVTYAMYCVLVFNPGDLDTLEQNKDEFYEWLRGYDWDNYDENNFKDDLDRWNQESYNIDLALKHGFVSVTHSTDKFVYPYDFEVICGHPGTFENGEYDMVFIGISGGFCMFSMDTFKYRYSFFVIPEVPLGTIMTLIPMIGSLVVIKRKEIF